jgi:hypothetical protein
LRWVAQVRGGSTPERECHGPPRSPGSWTGQPAAPCWPDGSVVVDVSHLDAADQAGYVARLPGEIEAVAKEAHDLGGVGEAADRLRLPRAA